MVYLVYIPIPSSVHGQQSRITHTYYAYKLDLRINRYITILFEWCKCKGDHCCCGFFFH